MYELQFNNYTYFFLNYCALIELYSFFCCFNQITDDIIVIYLSANMFSLNPKGKCSHTCKYCFGRFKGMKMHLNSCKYNTNRKLCMHCYKLFDCQSTHFSKCAWDPKNGDHVCKMCNKYFTDLGEHICKKYKEHALPRTDNTFSSTDNTFSSKENIVSSTDNTFSLKVKGDNNIIFIESDSNKKEADSKPVGDSTNQDYAKQLVKQIKNHLKREKSTHNACDEHIKTSKSELETFFNDEKDSVSAESINTCKINKFNFDESANQNTNYEDINDNSPKKLNNETVKVPQTLDYKNIIFFFILLVFGTFYLDISSLLESSLFCVVAVYVTQELTIRK